MSGRDRLDTAARRAAIDAALGQGDIAQAARLAEAAMAAGEEDVQLLNLCAWAREELGDFAGSHRLLDRALRLAPGDASALAAKGSAFRREGRLAEALGWLDRAIGRAPGYAAAWLDRGLALEAGGSYERAAESYARAARLDPQMAPALAGLAGIAALRGDMEKAARLAELALDVDPDDPVATRALARTELEAGRPEAAARRLERLLLAAPLGLDEQASIQAMIGAAREKMGDAPAAAAAFAAMNAGFRRVHARQLGAGLSQRDLIAALTASVAAAPDLPPARPARRPEGLRGHVFLLGYPRSGTTLAQTILGSGPGVATLEERATLVDADRMFLDGPGALDALWAQDETALDELRAAYWRRVAQAGVDVAGQVFIDMDPLKSLRLPLIARLFPEARIVLTRRDPRDVVWSCWRTLFAPTSAAWAFSDMAEAAAHYDATMRLTEASVTRLGLTPHVLRYEALVTNFEATTRALADFTGIGWHEGMRRFDRSARARTIGTASATQVRRGLYDGSGQWRPFAETLAPVLPVVQPWVERFGYPG